MGVLKGLFGYLPDGRAITEYTLEAKGGMRCAVLDLGGIITQLLVPDLNGDFANVVCGFDRAIDYFRDRSYHGAIIGRVANRIANGSFVLDGREYVLSKNLGNHHHHGGVGGFSRRFWRVTVPDERVPEIVLQYTSPAGEEGYPANLDVRVTYALRGENTLSIRYEASADAPTPVNLSHHPYFNLASYHGNTVCDHTLWLDASRYLENNAEGLPTGHILSVTGTPMDFSVPKRVGVDIRSDFSAISMARGFDHCFCFDGEGALCHRATLSHKASGREMRVYTTQPAVHLYTANFFNKDLPMRGGYRQQPHFGLCLETQKMPDSVHHSHFTNTVLRPREKYDHTTEYVFSVIR